MTDFGDVLGGAAKGAAAGMALGPIGAGAGAAVGLAMQLLPGVAHLFSGDDSTAAKVAGVVQAVTGTADPAAQAAAVADPSVAADLRQRLAEIAADRQAAELAAEGERLKAIMADVAGARQQTVTLATQGSVISWGAPVLSGIILLSFAGVVGVVLTRAIPDGSAPLANVLLGTLAALAALATQVANYWLGSSAGSARKTDLLGQSVPAGLIPQPAAVVPAADVRS